jgi:D-threo-aldose 1-dehydrogenase
VDVVMLAGRYTLLDQSALHDLLPLAVERGVGVVAAGVYNSGLLARAIVPDDGRFEYQAASPRHVALARELAEICARHGVTLPDVAVQFPLRHPAVVSSVLGARDGRQSMGGLERYATPIPDDLWVELEASGYLPAAA